MAVNVVVAFVADELTPGIDEASRGLLHRRAHRATRFLLPQREQVQEHGQHRRALNHLDEADLGEIREQLAERHAGGDHADQQHHVHQRDHARACFLGREVGGECEAGGLRGLQTGADQQEGEGGGELADPHRTKIKSANGMMARPPNCNKVPIQIYGTRRQPRADTWLSERKPMNARNGANTSGKPTISDTSHAGTPSSTMSTRFNVPIISTMAIPTDTWNSDSRSSRPSGNSALAASANGRKSVPIFIQRLTSFCRRRIMV
jgi:hypothetical protein